MWNIYNIQNNLNLDKNLLHFIHIFICDQKKKKPRKQVEKVMSESEMCGK